MVVVIVDTPQPSLKICLGRETNRFDIMYSLCTKDGIEVQQFHMDMELGLFYCHEICVKRQLQYYNKNNHLLPTL